MRSRGGRKPVSREVRGLIVQMLAENRTWGAPRIHGELLMLGFEVSEATVSRWMRQAPRSPHLAQRWLTFLRNHREAIAAMDFFTVPTLTFGVLYCFFVIAHDRRRILHCNVTRNPSVLWVGVQLRAVWQEGEEPQRFLLFDRDSKFAGDVVSLVKAMGSQPLRTAFRSPLAKRCSRTLGRQCTTGPAGSRHPTQRAASATVAKRVYPLLSRRQDPSRAGEGYSRGSNCRVNPCEPEPGNLPAAIGRLASPLCCCSLASHI